MNDQVDEVKQKTDIVTLIGSHIELKKAGSKYKGLCPFHAEKTPSFVVSPEIQIYKCFGCQKTGDVFTFLEDYEGMEFSEALKLLAEKADVKLKPIKGQEKGIKEKLYEINSLVLKFYEYCLHKHPSGKSALDYLTRERGLTLNTIKSFNIGYSPNEPLALRKFVVERNKVSYGDLEQTGVTYKSQKGTFDRFRGRVVFPLFDQRGNVAGFAGRVLPGAFRELAKYINTPETTIYKKSQILYGLNETKKDIKKEGVAIVVEGEFDLINSWQVGIKNIVAIKGSALTEEQVKLLSRFAKTLILALDEDFAGNEAAIRGIKIAQKEGFEIKVARLKNYKDPGEAALGDPKELKDAILNAVDIWDFIISFIFDKFGGAGGNIKAKISREIVPVLLSIEDKIVQAHYVNLVAKKLNVPVEAVTNELYKVNQKGGRSPVASFVDLKVELKTRKEILEENLLSVIFKTDPKLLGNKQISELLTSPFSKKILFEYRKFTEKSKFEIAAFKNALPPELREGFVGLVLKEIQGLNEEDSDILKEEIKMIIRNLEIHQVRRELSEVAEKIKNSEEYGKIDDLKEAQGKFSQLTMKLSRLEASNFKGIIL